ncbi:MAG: AI-2E family transporter [Zetaproteobacteria bacterium]|nr:MAG: AI-2E family transporter [Zetaproteobacteria bacterium]
MQAIKTWVDRQLADTEMVALMASLLVLFGLLALFGDTLAPVLVAIALAYVLDGVMDLLGRCRVPRLISIFLVGAGAILFILFALLAVVPLLSEQVGRLVSQAPHYVSTLRDSLHTLQDQYASWINPDYVQRLASLVVGKLQEWGAAVFSFSLASIPGLITLLVYVVLVPVLVFFLLKDKGVLIAWGQRFLPRHRVLLNRVWGEVDIQIGNYIRGKFWEMFVVGVVTWLVLLWCGHQYAPLLGALTGISVWIPFVGAAVVTIPVVLLSFFQWGVSDATLYALIAYGVVQALDANLLVPWLFSEVVNIHPIAIIVAILVFGSLWGVLGIFIAIPMAALVQSVLQVMMGRKPPGMIAEDTQEH